MIHTIKGSIFLDNGSIYNPCNNKNFLLDVSFNFFLSLFCLGSIHLLISLICFNLLYLGDKHFSSQIAVHLS